MKNDELIRCIGNGLIGKIGTVRDAYETAEIIVADLSKQGYLRQPPQPGGEPAYSGDEPASEGGDEKRVIELVATRLESLKLNNASTLQDRIFQDKHNRTLDVAIMSIMDIKQR